MRDDLGFYYYPILENKNIRMYVRAGVGDVEFRMWNAEDQGMWDEHGWVEWSAIQQAAELYREEGRKGKPPLHLYDPEIAKRLLKDASD
ncbi:MAG: hypothetical protein BA864_06830 [Desulfuromonadales bacterium C00003093]|nr:MAG: hypothetical protein BA864_06830 [Desulfuromonadales bacterium C00003093]